ncbi:hypothetical protein [Endozoicomonas sp. 8E]|uniref:hypothetical protein n=1 Tax=Endozoicomonas sp. 8E TaxID=3035692 RepID=UPI0029390BD4|nr:hypothetical protein [Endozoicomonas sp. 8E]WOG28009.1 hypothetical protein P6910_26285 [Endozoicomonas sp. 8E]
MTTQQLPVEVTSTQAIYLTEGRALPFPDTQCMYTEIEGEQVCFGNRTPARVGLQPGKNMKLGLSPQSISQLRYNASLPPQTPLTPTGPPLLPEFDSGSGAVATEIKKGVNRHDEITEAAKQSSQLCLFRYPGEDKDGLISDDKQEEDEVIEWYVLEENENEPDDSNEAKIQYEESLHEGTPLKPDTRYCILRHFHNESRISKACPDGEGATGGEGQSTTENTRNQENGNEDASEETSENMDEENQHETIEACSTCGGSFCEHAEFYFDIPIKKDAPKAASKKAKRYACTDPKCNLRFTSTSNRNIHVRRKHTRERPYACTDSKCDRRFAANSDRDAHVSRKHNGDKPHACKAQDCIRRFATTSDRDSHIRREHTGERPYACTDPKCDLRFPSISNRNVHVRRHHTGEKPHACTDSECDRRFAVSSDRDTHVRRKHDGEKNYICADPKCNRRFFSKFERNGHFTRMHNSEPKPKRQRIEGELFAPEGANLKD